MALTPLWAGVVAPCQDGTLSSYLALNPDGCSMGILNFSAFAFSSSSAAVSARTVQVAVVDSGDRGLRFSSAGFSATGGRMMLVNLAYLVASSAPIDQWSVAMLDAAAAADAVVTLTENITPPNSATRLGYARLTASAPASGGVLAAAPMTVQVRDQLLLQSKRGSASLDGFENTFHSPPTPPVPLDDPGGLQAPEPLGVALAAGGLAALLWLRRRG